MRVFIALEMPDEARDRLRPCLSQLAREIPAVKWVAAQNLHLTIKFLGEVSKEQVADLDGMLTTIAMRSVPFVLTYERAGFFRSGEEPSVIWLGIAHHEQLQALASQVTMESMTLLPTNDRKPFQPHITLGRVRQPYGGPPLLTAIERIDSVVLPNWSVQALSLIKSELTPKGPVYTTLSRYQLGGK